MSGLGRSRQLLGPHGPLATAFEGYEDREGQLAMTDAVERSIDEGSTLICEAGTGTGKTLAYLVPAALSDKRVVISTATKALQEQVFSKDLPVLGRHLGLAPVAVMLKGISNYLCRRRFDELRKSPQANADPQIRRALPMVEHWVEDTESGDLAELASLGEAHPIMAEIASSSETRIGSSCKHYEECFVTKVKREAERARIVIVNHHLFFADLAVKLAAERRGFGGAGVLPAYEAVVFDEAHEIEDAATMFFGVRVSGSRFEAMSRDADKAFIAAGLADRILGKGEGTALAAMVRESARDMFDKLVAIAQAVPASDRARSADPSEVRANLPRDAWQGDVVVAYLAVDQSLEALAGYAGANNNGDEAVRLVAQRASALRDDLARIVEPERDQVTWIEARGRSVSIGASPIELGHVFRERVVERIGAVVLASATLTTGGSFRFLRRRLGLDEACTVPVEELSVASPFDYASQCVLYVARDLPEVSDATFIARATERIAELCRASGGGAFVLCTSNRSTRLLAEGLSRVLATRPLVQGEAPKGRLIARFRAERDAVLVATMSFWEGVDVPGDALRLVIIEKLPFAVPTDPLVVARCRAIEDAGQNPFVAYSVPEAAITLKQGFGRLIRARTDHGVVAMLDRRLVTRSYGKILLDSLPPARRTERLDDVRAFYAERPLPPRASPG
jgi:ATP-dependent DNA helicase DinG